MAQYYASSTNGCCSFLQKIWTRLLTVTQSYIILTQPTRTLYLNCQLLEQGDCDNVGNIMTRKARRPITEAYTTDEMKCKRKKEMPTKPYKNNLRFNV
jgi:hypothetical protein